VWSQTGTKTDSQRGTSGDPGQRPDEAAKKQGVPASGSSSTTGSSQYGSSTSGSSQSGSDMSTSSTSGSRSGMRRSAMRDRTGSQEDVRAAQEALRDKGFDPGPIDGILGPRTQAALRSFQQSKNLQATGRLDSQTEQQLGVHASMGSTGSSNMGSSTSGMGSSGTSGSSSKSSSSGVGSSSSGMSSSSQTGASDMGKTGTSSKARTPTDSQKGNETDPGATSDENARKEGVPAKSSSGSSSTGQQTK